MPLVAANARFGPSINVEKKKRRNTVRTVRSHRITSATRISQAPKGIIALRKSLFDCIQEEMRKNNRFVFLQRVFVLGQNILLDDKIHDVERDAKDEGREMDEFDSEESDSELSIESIILAPEDQAPVTTEEVPSVEEPVPPMIEGGRENVVSVANDVEVFEPPMETALADTTNPGISAYPDTGFQRSIDPDAHELIETLENIELLVNDESLQSILTPHGEDEGESEDSLPYLPPTQTPLQIALEKAAYDCNHKSFSEHKIAIFLLTMGKYCLLVVEGTEDMVGDYLERATIILAEFWSTDRVLTVDDNIPRCFLKGFVNRYAPEININEQYPPSVPNDVDMMGKQHWQLEQKVRNLCEQLGSYLESKDAKPHKGEILPPDEYNKLLPEVQRIELVFNSKRFYRPLLKYSRIYNILPVQVDDDSLIWPMPYNYTPADVFLRMPHDVNLTFAEYIDKAFKKFEERPLFFDDVVDVAEKGGTKDLNAPPAELNETGDPTEAGELTQPADPTNDGNTELAPAETQKNGTTAAK